MSKLEQLVKEWRKTAETAWDAMEAERNGVYEFCADELSRLIEEERR